MRPTGWRSVLGLAVLAAIIAYAALALGYGTLPTLPVGLPVSLGLLAAFVAAVAVSTRERLAARFRRPGPRKVRPLDPLAAARVAVLARAASLVGAFSTGLCAGGAGWLLPRAGRLAAARHDATVVIIGLVCAVALLASGLYLERVCRAPDPPEDGDDR